MENYSSVSSHTEGHVAPPFPSELDDHERASGLSPTAEPQRWRDTAISWWHSTLFPAPANPAPVQSGYLTLIPLSDDRLKPRRTKLTVAVLLSLAMLLAGIVFILVPREVTSGEIRIFSDQMSWNSTKGTYQLDLLAHVPIYNPNYLAATVEGRLSVYFYDTMAGERNISSKVVKARAVPHVLHVPLDASNVPSEYALTILSECAAFPRRLIFFLKATFTAQYLVHHQVLPMVDTYFMIDCVRTLPPLQAPQ